MKFFRSLLAALAVTAALASSAQDAPATGAPDPLDVGTGRIRPTQGYYLTNIDG